MILWKLIDFWNWCFTCLLGLNWENKLYWTWRYMGGKTKPLSQLFTWAFHLSTGNGVWRTKKWCHGSEWSSWQRWRIRPPLTFPFVQTSNYYSPSSTITTPPVLFTVQCAMAQKRRKWAPTEWRLWEYDVNFGHFLFFFAKSFVGNRFSANPLLLVSKLPRTIWIVLPLLL